MPPTVTGFPITLRGAACIITGLMIFGQAMGAGQNGSAWDCHTNPAGTVECVGKPAGLVEPEQQPQPTLTEPESTTAPAEPPDTQTSAPAEPADALTVELVEPLDTQTSAPAEPADALTVEPVEPLDTQRVKPEPDVSDTIPAPVAGPEPEQSIGPPAADLWRLCATTATRSSRLDIASIEEARRNAAIDVEADSVELQENQIYTLTGNVAFQRADQHLEAQHLVYDKQQGSVAAEGNIYYSESGLSVNSERMQLDMNSNHAQLEDVEYYVPAGHARGYAKQVSLEGPGVQHLTKTTYTTCDAAHEDWRLSARQVTLLQDEGVGRAKGVVMRFKKIPIFYTPYLSFPLAEHRKSGFLAPTIGGSDESGTDTRLPFYWNIAPNRDAIITPRRLEKRGTQLGAEFRYLNRKNTGKASVEYLPSDNEFGKDRSLIAFEHRGRPTSRINTVFLFKEVSDREYFEDLGDSLNIASTTHLERRAEASYRGNHMRLSARVQDFQTVDSAISNIDKPYKRLPQIRFAGASPWQPLSLRSGLRAEYTYFDHDVKLSGQRLDLTPRISLPLQNSAYSFTPQVAVRYTRYELDDPLTPGASKSPDRTTPIYSVDSRLFLERETGFRSNRFLHTLEPRLYYLYVPERNQDKLPVFDTGELDFQYNQMFVENRFNGPDRMGDANQITLALTTRILDPATGKQHLRASIGEIFYFQDLAVALPGKSVVKNNQSDIIGEFQLQLLRQWKLSAGLQWNPNDSRTERGQTQIQYSPNPRHIVNLSYRYRRDILDQVDASLLWQLTPKWSAVGRWNYSFDDRTTLESFAGFEYDSCCWAIRYMAREYINRNNGDSNRSIYFQLEFKGLGAVGKPVEDLLERGILGYRRNP